MERNLILHPSFQQNRSNELPPDLSRWVVPRNSSAEEGYRVLATRLRTRVNGPGQILGITSALPSEGKTCSSLNLGRVLARDFRYKVLYMEADLKRPTVSRGNRHLSGLIEYVDGDCPLEGAIHGTDLEGFDVMVAGHAEGCQPVQVLGDPATHRALLRFRERYDFVVVDCPPLMAASDIGLIAEWVDDFLLVIRAGSTDRSVVRDAVQGIGRERFLGVLLGDKGLAMSYSTTA